MLACEIDAEYFASAVERIGRDLQQQTFAMTRNNALSEQEADDGSAERGTE
jgi:hypothetical protein